MLPARRACGPWAGGGASSAGTGLLRTQEVGRQDRGVLVTDRLEGRRVRAGARDPSISVHHRMTRPSHRPDIRPMHGRFRCLRRANCCAQPSCARLRHLRLAAYALTGPVGALDGTCARAAGAMMIFGRNTVAAGRREVRGRSWSGAGAGPGGSPTTALASLALRCGATPAPTQLADRDTWEIRVFAPVGRWSRCNIVRWAVVKHTKQRGPRSRGTPRRRAGWLTRCTVLLPPGQRA